MKTIATVKLNQLAARYGEHVPVATTTCCNACRTCVQTNVITIGLGAVAATAAAARRYLAKRSS
jgi:hypothetical protein